jgi:hypothetical protein
VTDKQAKYVAIEATWKIVLKGDRFPTLHGSSDLEEALIQIHANLAQHYEYNAARVFSEVLVRETIKHQRRMQCLKVVVITLTAAALILFLSALL